MALKQETNIFKWTHKRFIWKFDNITMLVDSNEYLTFYNDLKTKELKIFCWDTRCKYVSKPIK